MEVATSKRSRTPGSRGLGVFSFCLLLACASGCESCLDRVPTESVERLPYPTCDGEPMPRGELLHQGHLRATPEMRHPDVVERYAFRRRGCNIVATVHQFWPMGVADVEVVFDAEWRPLRAWKRMTLPGAEDVEDIRLYELRSAPPTLVRRSSEGREHFFFRGGRPIAVVGPGRGLLSAYIKAADLEIGETTRGPVLDFRDMVEKVETIALRRDANRDVPGLGEVRVYTVFGRESVFTDDEGWVVGDLAGMRPVSAVDAPMPPELSSSGSAPDPVSTP